MNYDYVLSATDSNGKLFECSALCLCKALELSFELTENIEIDLTSGYIVNFINGNRTMTDFNKIKINVSSNTIEFISTVSLGSKVLYYNYIGTDGNKYNYRVTTSEPIVLFDLTWENAISDANKIELLTSLLFGKIVFKQTENDWEVDTYKLVPISNVYYPVQWIESGSGSIIPSITTLYFTDDGGFAIQGVEENNTFPIKCVYDSVPMNMKYICLYKISDFDGDTLVNNIPIVRAEVSVYDSEIELLNINAVENFIGKPGKYMDDIKILGSVNSAEVISLKTHNDLDELPSKIDILNVSE